MYSYIWCEIWSFPILGPLLLSLFQLSGWSTNWSAIDRNWTVWSAMTMTDWSAWDIWLWADQSYKHDCSCCVPEGGWVVRISTPRSLSCSLFSSESSFWVWLSHASGSWCKRYWSDTGAGRHSHLFFYKILLLLFSHAITVAQALSHSPHTPKTDYLHRSSLQWYNTELLLQLN